MLQSGDAMPAGTAAAAATDAHLPVPRPVLPPRAAPLPALFMLLGVTLGTCCHAAPGKNNRWEYSRLFRKFKLKEAHFLFLEISFLQLFLYVPGLKSRASLLLCVSFKCAIFLRVLRTRHASGLMYVYGRVQP